MTEFKFDFFFFANFFWNCQKQNYPTLKEMAKVKKLNDSDGWVYKKASTSVA